MLKFTSIVGYTSCGPTYIESFLTIFGQCINVLNYKYHLTFFSSNFSLCLHFLVSSFRLFKVAHSSLHRIKNFSAMHKLHRFVIFE